MFALALSVKNRLAIVAATIGSFLKNHIIGIIVVGIFCSIAATYICGWMQAVHPATESAGVKLSHSQSESVPQDREAPLVRFVDGKRAYINFATVTRVLEKNTSRVVIRSGDRQHAESALIPPTEAAIYSVFEKLSYGDVRARREELEIKLLEILRPRYELEGITLDSISLKSFTLISD